MKYFYVYPDPISRSFWAVLVAAMFMMAWFLTYLLYMRFADMPTRITIENQYESIKDLPYPTITICSPNKITIAAVHHLNKTLVDGNVTADLDRIIPIVLGFYDPALQSSDDTAHQLQSLIDLNRYTTTEVMAMLPQQCDEFLQMCQLGHTRYPHCRGLFDPVLTTYGLCCSFNSKYHYVKSNKRNEVKANFTSRLAFSSSLNNAFTVVVDYNPAGAIDRTILAAGGIRYMSKVLFTDHTEFPAEDVSNLVLTNTESLHIIHATHTYCSEDVKVLPVSSRKCYLQDERHLPYFHDYHNSDCDHVCFADSIKNYCGCELFYLPYVRLTHVCNASKIKCIGETKRHYCDCELFYLPNVRLTHVCNASKIKCIGETKLSRHPPQKASTCKCLRDCESRRYTVELSTGNLDALPYMFNDMYRDIKFNKSTAIMHFFFPNSVYVKQKQETVISIVTLASNLGGVFGLCVGVSFISALELPFYIYMAIKNNIKYQMRKRSGRIVHLK
ncbi:sodium channel protein Nach-like [Ostrinia nubilalis]|uniref:sodium channel protein Nach-like n=1 Tax=Ostrinia nubilalis TaxID=29057 RepID=UPI00308236F1